MPGNLHDAFGELARRVPVSASGEEDFLFTRQSLPRPPSRLTLQDLVIHKTFHDYGAHFRAERLVWHLRRETCRHLALLILAVVFHPEPERVEVELADPDSEVKRLIVEYVYPDPADIAPGYHTQPYAFEYYPGRTEKHPWVGCHPDPWDLPSFQLTNASQLIVSEQDWQQRDTVVGFGSDRGSVRLAQLFLDASRPDNPVTEYELESEGGFRGVAPLSAEATLFLPGSWGWEGKE